MSNLPLLPLVRIAYGASPSADFAVSLAFGSGGQAVDLTGIAFVASLSTPGWTSGPIAGAVSGAQTNIVTFAVAVADRAAWPSGNATFVASASADEGAKDVVAPSLVSLSAASELAVSVAAGFRPVAAAVAVPAWLQLADFSSPAVVAAIEAIVLAYLTGLGNSAVAPGDLFINNNGGLGGGPVTVS